MSFEEKIKDVGRHIIGEGEEVRFKNEVAKFEKLHGVSHEQFHMNRPRKRCSLIDFVTYDWNSAHKE